MQSAPHSRIRPAHAGSPNSPLSLAAALLGSTPELRSLAAAMNMTLLCLDKSEARYKAFGHMVVSGDGSPALERFLEADWLDARIPPADVVLSDGSISMLPPSLHAQFVRSVAGMLKPGGLFLVRMHLAKPPAFDSPEGVFRWSRLPPQRRHDVFTTTRTHLEMLWKDSQHGVHFPSTVARLEAMWQNGSITEEEYMVYKRLQHPSQEFRMWYIDESHFRRMLHPWFRVWHSIAADDYPASNHHPMMALVRSHEKLVLPVHPHKLKTSRHTNVVGLFETCVTGAALSLLADSIAQLLELRRPEASATRWDIARSGWALAWGLLMLGLLLTQWFRLLAEWFPKANTDFRELAAKVVVNQVMLSPTLNAGLLALAVFTRSPPSANKCALLLHKLRTALPRMIMRALFFWSTVTTFNFWLIRQPEHAVLMNDVAMVVWSTYVSLEAYSSQGRQ